MISIATKLVANKKNGNIYRYVASSVYKNIVIFMVMGIPLSLKNAQTAC